jgi:hypothetical protein
MKTSEVLKHAKRYLAKSYAGTYNYVHDTYNEKFICIAIMTAATQTKRIPVKDIERCKDMIESRLEGADTLEGWLNYKGYLPTCSLDTDTRNRIQQHRHAWLDLLIAEFESKGD